MTVEVDPFPHTIDFVDALETFVADIRRIFGARLHAIVVYDAVAPAVSGQTSNHIQTLTLVDAVKFEDVAACAARSSSWERIGLATPLIVGDEEFRRSLDTFPLEYGNIIATHRVIAGSNPFKDLTVQIEDLRHASESLAKSHLLHLREAYIEAEGQPDAVARMMVASVAPFRALLLALAHLRGRPTRDAAVLVGEVASIGLDASTVQRVLDLRDAGQLSSAETIPFFTSYLDVVEQLARHVDRWQEEGQRAKVEGQR
jgi:hypothetical protein